MNDWHLLITTYEQDQNLAFYVDGTLVGDASFVTEGKFGGAVTFDGNFDYVDVENELFVDGQNSYTAACWFRVSELDGTRQMLFETSETWAVSAELSPTDNNLKYSVETDGTKAISTVTASSAAPTWIWFERTGTPPARRLQCTSNMRQIALALHNYHSSHRHGGQHDRSERSRS